MIRLVVAYPYFRRSQKRGIKCFFFNSCNMHYQCRPADLSGELLLCRAIGAYALLADQRRNVLTEAQTADNRWMTSPTTSELEARLC